MTTTIRTLQRASRREWRRVKGILRTESVGGFILLGATVAALVCANLTPNYYKGLRDTQLGFDVGSLHLSLTVGHWTSDGLLAVFFFLAGLELKREFVAGDLRDPRRALAPIVAAACGVAVPALLYAAINVSAGPEALRGWAIPSATDIAFALAVLAVIGSHLPGFSYEECAPYGSEEPFIEALHCTDQLLERFLARIEAAGYLDDTTVVVTADHHVWLYALSSGN